MKPPTTSYALFSRSRKAYFRRMGHLFPEFSADILHARFFPTLEAILDFRVERPKLAHTVVHTVTIDDKGPLMQVSP